MDDASTINLKAVTCCFRALHFSILPHVKFLNWYNFYVFCIAPDHEVKLSNYIYVFARNAVSYLETIL